MSINPSKLGALYSRLITDYGNTNELCHYQDVLKQARNKNYRVITVKEHYNIVRADSNQKRLLILRHDIDTDPTCALEFSRLELAAKVRSTYYFRVRTAQPDVVMQIANAGHDIGYHCEDLATVAKRRKVQTKTEMLSCLCEARELACENIAALRQLAGVPITHASSHGDFMNRRMGVTNRAIFDQDFRLQNNIKFEAYDDFLSNTITCRASDASSAATSASTITEGMAHQTDVAYYLTHPRRWRSGRYQSLQEDLIRISETIKLAFPY